MIDSSVSINGLAIVSGAELTVNPNTFVDIYENGLVINGNGDISIAGFHYFLTGVLIVNNNRI